MQLEAITAGSWLDRDEGLAVVDAAEAVYAREVEAGGPQYVEADGAGREITIRHPNLANGQVSAFRITLPGDERTINLSELAVISGAEDVAQRAELSQSSEYNGGEFPIENLVDGDRINFSHTSFEANPWIEARFDPPVAIDEVKLWNRAGFESRFDRAQIEFFGGSTTLVLLEVKLDTGAGIFADPWLRAPVRTARAHLEGQTIVEAVVVEVPEHLEGSARDMYLRGAEIYGRDGHCSTCHQPDGLGLTAGGFPPLSESPWVTDDEERLIKLTLNGLLGPMEVKGKRYPGLVPMTAFGEILDDEELADVLTYVRNSFGNRAAPVAPERIAEVRVATQLKEGFWSPEELLGEAVPAGAVAASRRFVKNWSVADLAGELATPLTGRDFANGRAMFAAASCNTCHNLEGRGGNVGADLSRAGQDYPGAELLRQILEPSATIRESHRLWFVELRDESVYNGLVVGETADTLMLAESLQEPDLTVTVAKADIIERRALDVSPMPTGLLATLTRDEVLDLLAYVATNGDAESEAFGD